MPYYEWQRSDPFRDHANSREVTEGEVVELPEAVADSAYGFVEADEPDAHPGDDGDEADGPDADDGEANPDTSSEEEICGTEMTDGSLCQRPAGECPYH